MKHHFESALAPRGIDAENGIVKGACVCTSGIEAKGHGLRTDNVLLRQLLLSAQQKGTIPVGLDHKSGVKGTAGAATNFRISGDKLLADIQFFPTHPNFELVMDQLQALGNTMGISASFTGDADGEKARCRELLSCDVVNFPAANPTGLFSALNENSDHPETENEEDNMTDEIDNDSMTEEQLAAVLHELMDHVQALEEENEQLREALEIQDDDDVTDRDDEQEDPVIEEHGIRSGPHTNDHRALLQSHDFEGRIEAFKCQGLDSKAAHIAALKEFARSKYQMLNL